MSCTPHLQQVIKVHGMQESGTPVLPAMAAMELACAAGAYICADRHPVVTNSVLGASLALHTAATLDLTCDLRTGSLSIQSVLSCTLMLLPEVSIHPPPHLPTAFAQIHPTPS